MPYTLDAYGVPVPGDPVQLPDLSVENLANLRSFITKPTQGTLITTRGELAEGDGGGATWMWVDFSITPDEGSTVIKATALAAGRFFLFSQSGDPGVSSTITVDGIVTHGPTLLTTVSVTGLPSYSTSAWCKAVGDLWRLVPDTGATPDDITICDAIDGRQWIRTGTINKAHQAQALTPGLYANAATGDNENPGTELLPLAGTAEFNRRMFGAVFSGSPRIHLQTDMAAGGDGVFFGWQTQSGFRLYVIGTDIPITLAGNPVSVTLNGASNLDVDTTWPYLRAAGSQGDFSSNNWTSDTDRTVYAKRADASGGKTTYAPINSFYDSGGNHFAKTGPQFAYSSPSVPTIVAPTQVFASGDAVLLVRPPRLPRLTSDIPLTPVGVDFPLNTYRSEMIPYRCGFRGRPVFIRGAVGTISQFAAGCQFTAGWQSESCPMFMKWFGLGGGTATHSEATCYGVGGVLLEFNQLNCTLNADGVKLTIDGAVVSDTPNCFSAQSQGEILVGWAPATLNSAVGVGVDGATIAASYGYAYRGSKIYGTQFFTELTPGPATPWNVLGSAYSSAALPIEDEGAAIYD